MSYYKKHLFFCTNQRDPGKKCCADAGASNMREYAKEKLKNLGLIGKGEIRVSSAGCLGRCKKGPILLIYPEGVWYQYQSIADVDEIINTHVVQGGLVERLLIDEQI